MCPDLPRETRSHPAACPRLGTSILGTSYVYISRHVLDEHTSYMYTSLLGTSCMYVILGTPCMYINSRPCRLPRRGGFPVNGDPLGSLPSTINPPLSTLNPPPSTLNPPPSNLNSPRQVGVGVVKLARRARDYSGISCATRMLKLRRPYGRQYRRDIGGFLRI